MIHTVRAPFMCRYDQFKEQGYPGRVLVVGISVDALKGSNPYRFKIGKREYSGDSQKALEIAYIWRNNQGKSVAIVPVELFNSSVYA